MLFLFPQSDTFTEGDLQEGPNLTITEPLSREGTPQEGASPRSQRPGESPMIPGTPERSKLKGTL